MLWSRFIFMLMLALVSARPSPELSLEEIEKELEQLTAQESDSPETKKTSDQEDTSKNTQSEAPKELTDKAREVSLKKLEALEKSVTNIENKKDETEKTEAETEKKTTDTSADAALLPEKSAKPVPEELTHRDTTDADTKSDSSTRGLPKLSFKDTGAYRRLMEINDPRLPSLPKSHYFPESLARRTYGGDFKYGLPPRRRPYYPEAPIRRTYEGSYRKTYDDPPGDSSTWNRRGFLPNSDPIEALRGVASEMTKAERMALSRGTWLPDNEPVKVPPRLPPPAQPDVNARSYTDVHQQLNDRETEDLIHGKTGMTDLEKRKRYLMDLLAEKLKSKVNEAQKRGLKIPSKIMDFLWNYESRRGLDTQSDKNLLSH